MRAYCLLIAAILISTALRADYLITSRSANVKEEPLGSAATREHVEAGVRLELLDDGLQTHEYYHVQTQAGTVGWIYRTLVRRYKEGDDNSPSTTSTTTSTLSGDVEITAIDVGAGLSCLIRLPGNKYMIYDGGRSTAMTYLKKEMPVGAAIELLVLSHTDADHWGAVEQIVNEYKVKKVLRTDYRDGSYSGIYLDAVDAIENVSYDLEDHNLGVEGDLQPGQLLYNKDGVKLYALCGFKEPPAAWNLTESKATNSVSIVIRLEYQNHSVIFAGDAVGREDCEEDHACIATEKFMIDQVSGALLNADVLVAAHHGADNASCEMFIDKVSPDYVIFSAGNVHRHPRQSTAERFIDFGVDPDRIYRTDRGGQEDGDGDVCKLEWSDDQSGGDDKTGDDHIRIVLPKTGSIKVHYLN